MSDRAALTERVSAPGGLAAVLGDWLAVGVPVAHIRVLQARGSTPREAGAAMLVTAAASHGTIGGGRLEAEAIGRARSLLALPADAAAPVLLDISLGPEIGQCCGGRVRLRIMRADTALQQEIAASEQVAAAQRPLVLVFGAGHVGRALCDALALLPLRVWWIDGRPGAFDGIASAPAVSRLTEADGDGERWIAAAPPGSAVVVMTHSHALDALITEAALRRSDLAYVGLIGSRTKRRRFLAGFRDAGLPEQALGRLVCPIGAGLDDKRPEVIAALVAAELLRAFATHAATAPAAA